MKMDKDFAIVAGVLFVVILLTLAFSTEGISGFNKSPRGLVEYPYEGFASLQEAYEMREGMDEEEEEERGEGFQEGKRNRNRNTGTWSKKKCDKFCPTTVAAPVKQGFAAKVEGFEGLQSGPVNEQIIGFMYNNEASTTCKGYGYTTSKGNICMSDNDIKLLTTRGMNATGVSDQIGA
jgi:hypothetical protein